MCGARTPDGKRQSSWLVEGLRALGKPVANFADVEAGALLDGVAAAAAAGSDGAVPAVPALHAAAARCDQTCPVASRGPYPAPPPPPRLDAERVAGGVGKSRSGHDQVVAAFNKIEAFILWMLPESHQDHQVRAAFAPLLPASPEAHAQYVLALKRGEKPKEKISLDTATAFLTFLSSAADHAWPQAEGMGAGQDPVCGRGSLFPVCRKAAVLIAQVERKAFGFLSNFANERVVGILRDKKKGHVERGAPNFDVVVVRSRIVAVCSPLTCGIGSAANA